MSEAVIFVTGSVVFIATAWASIAFGMARISELQQRDSETAVPNPAGQQP